MWRDGLARGREGHQSVWKGGGTEGDSPYVLGPSPTSEPIGESGRLRVQSEWGDRSHPRLSTWETPIANKYGDGKVKRTSKGGSKALEIVEGEADLTDETSSSLARSLRSDGDFRRGPPHGASEGRGLRGARRRGRLCGTGFASDGGSPRFARKGAPGGLPEARGRPEGEGDRVAGQRAEPGGLSAVFEPRGSGRRGVFRLGSTPGFRMA